ncbi:MAG: carboxypeptidase regulatory-like domain-containing protein [Planctomycetota bacterium]|jgi:hypothetical protein
MTPLLVLLLAAPGTLRVELEQGEGEVLALRNGTVVARATTKSGVTELRGLEGAFDVYARGRGGESALERGVRATDAPGRAADVLLKLEPVFPIAVEIVEGAVVHARGRTYPADKLVLPAGMHRIVVDHPEYVSSAARLLRVTGPARVKIDLDPGLVVTGGVAGGIRGVSGASVEVFADGHATNRKVRTGDRGMFGVSGFRGDVISLLIRAPGFADQLVRVVFHPGEERMQAGAVLKPGSSAEITAPVEAEAVLLPKWYEEVLEEPRLRAHHVPRRVRGTRMRFDGLAPGRRYSLIVSAAGMLPVATAPFVAPAAGEVKLLGAVAFAPAASLQGGAGAAGRVVVCRGPTGMAVSRTDRAGRYRFDGLDAGDHIVYVRDVDEVARKVTLAAGTETKLDLDVAPADPQRAIKGRVLDGSGKPLAGVEVRAARLVARTDAEGRFALRGLPRGRSRYDVRCTPGPGCPALADDPHLPHTEPRAHVGSRLRIALTPAATVRIRFDTGGYPLARATLQLETQGGLAIRRRLPRRAEEVVLNDVPVGSYTADVAAPGLLGSDGQVIAVKRGVKEPITLRVARGRRVSGRVVFRRVLPRDEGPPKNVDMPPKGRAWVTLFDAHPARAMATTPVEEDGTFVLQGLPLGRVLLVAGGPGHPPTPVELDLAASDLDGVVIALRAGVSAAVLVTGDDERPLPEAAVKILDMIRPDFGVDVRDLAAAARFRRVVADDEDFGDVGRLFSVQRFPSGRIGMTFLRPGSYRFDVLARGYKLARVGVRARTAWQRAQIEKTLEDVAEVPEDLTPRVRLARGQNRD